MSYRYMYIYIYNERFCYAWFYITLILVFWDNFGSVQNIVISISRKDDFRPGDIGRLHNFNNYVRNVCCGHFLSTLEQI